MHSATLERAYRTARQAGGRFGATAWDTAAPYTFVAPVLLLIALFIFWPLVYSFYLSTLQWNFVRPERTFVGLENFAQLPQDPRFVQAGENTVLYVLALVPIQVFLPLALALLLWPIRRSRAQTTYRITLFAPTVISFAVAALVWMWILSPLQGILNQAIVALGGSSVSWLSDPNTAIWAVIGVSAWKVMGFNLLLYMAALEAVPQDYVEAASLDGADGWQLTRYIRWPLISPTFFFVLVTTVIFVNDEVFGAINVMTNGGPFERTTNIVYYLFEQAFRYFQIGAASAVALVLFFGVVALTWLQFRFVERRVHYG